MLGSYPLQFCHSSIPLILSFLYSPHSLIPLFPSFSHSSIPLILLFLSFFRSCFLSSSHSFSFCFHSISNLYYLFCFMLIFTYNYYSYTMLTKQDLCNIIRNSYETQVLLVVGGYPYLPAADDLFFGEMLGCLTQ